MTKKLPPEAASFFMDQSFIVMSLWKERAVKTLNHTIERAGELNVTIYDRQGFPVKELSHGWFSEGPLVLKWDGTNNEGILLPEGIYIARIIRQGSASSRKIILLR